MPFKRLVEVERINYLIFFLRNQNKTIYYLKGNTFSIYSHLVCKVFSFVRIVTESQSEKKVWEKFDHENFGQDHGFYIQSIFFLF